jgi:hypothetical protein
MKKDKKPMDIIMASIGPKKPMEDEMEESMESPIDGIAQDLIDAVKSGDKGLVASALEAAFMHYDSEPHVEGPHLEE